jgi:hypothetical protein
MPNKNSTGRWMSTIAMATVGFVWSHAILPWLVLIGPPIMTGLLAYLGDAGGYKIALAVQFSFAAMAVGFYYADLELSRRRINGNLQFSSVRVGRNINGPGIFLGVVFSNTSDFPIEFEMKELRTRMGDRVPIKTAFDVKNVVVGPRAIGWFDDHIIQVDNAPKGGTLEGFLEYSVKYGRPGNLKYEMAQKKQTTAAFDADGNLTGASWQEAKRE